MLELKATLFIRVRLPSNPNMVVLNVELMRRLKCATSIAGMIVSGVLGPMMAVNCLALRLLALLVKTGKEKPAEFNLSRLTVVLNVLEIL
jgi:hypothetical protein